MMSETTRGILIRCDRWHEQRIATPDHDAAWAGQLARLIDSSNPLFLRPHEEHRSRGSPLGQCGLCGAWLKARLFGYDEEVEHD